MLMREDVAQERWEDPRRGDDGQDEGQRKERLSSEISVNSGAQG